MGGKGGRRGGGRWKCSQSSETKRRRERVLSPEAVTAIRTDDVENVEGNVPLKGV